MYNSNFQMITSELNNFYLKTTTFSLILIRHFVFMSLPFWNINKFLHPCENSKSNFSKYPIVSNFLFVSYTDIKCKISNHLDTSMIPIWYTFSRIASYLIKSRDLTTQSINCYITLNDDYMINEMVTCWNWNSKYYYLVIDNFANVTTWNKTVPCWV